MPLKIFRLPKWNFKVKFPKPVQVQHKKLYSIWKKFLMQFSAESRSIVKTHQHFIVLGNTQSGKSELIRGLIEQSQDLYPFETTYTSESAIQFYLGPKQVVQEISLPILEGKSIKLRKQMIRFWKRLFLKRDPIVIITYNCCTDSPQNSKEIYKLAQVIASKVSVLSEIRKNPIKIRVALTHLDKIEGYLEFARFLKNQGLSFQMNLSSNFEANILTNIFNSFYTVRDKKIN